MDKLDHDKAPKADGLTKAFWKRTGRRQTASYKILKQFSCTRETWEKLEHQIHAIDWSKRQSIGHEKP